MNNTAEVLADEKQPQSLGSMIDELAEIRSRKSELKNEIDDLDERYKALEREIITLLDAQQLMFGGGSRYRATISTSIVPTVQDWDAAIEWMKANDAFHLFEKRMAAGAWRELKDSGELIPGTEPYEKRSLSLRKL
jgi:DNA repair exonuclease SbcCD ATPase subunit